MTQSIHLPAGLATWLILTTACLGVGEERFYGGSFDGYSHGEHIRNATGAEAASLRFGGGGYDGYSTSDAIANSVGADAASRRFGGAGYDGYSASDAIANSVGAAASSRRFAGGAYDGYSTSDAIANPIAADAASSRFAGGGYDGYDDATATLTRFFPGRADLAVTKSGSATNTAGTAVTYTLVVSNRGPTRAINVHLNDRPPAGITLADAGPWDLGDLEPGVTTSIVIAAFSDAGALGNLTNRATVASDTFDPDFVNNTSQVETAIGGQANLSVAVTGPATATPGAPVTFVLAVTNAGPSDALAVELEDLLPAGMTAQAGTRFDLGTLFAGVGTSVVVIADIDSGATGVLVNTAVVRSPTPNPGGITTATVAVTLHPTSELQVTKTGPAIAVPGESAQFELAVTNAGPSDARRVEVEDLLPIGMIARGATQFDLGTLPAGIGTSVVVIADIDPAAVGSLTNTAVARAFGAEAVTSVFAVTLAPQSTLSVSKTGPATAVPGTSARFELAVTNAGPSHATGVMLEDLLPIGMSARGATQFDLGTLPVGIGTSVVVIADIDPAAVGDQTNAAIARGLTADAVTSLLAVALSPEADLVASLSAPSPVVAGETFAITLTVSNRGPSVAVLIDSAIVPGSGLDFLDLFQPAFADLQPGESTSADLSVRAPPDVEGVVTAAVSVAATTPDPSLNGNTGQVVIAVQRVANLSVTKFGPATALAGQTMAYSLVVSNAGPSEAREVRVEDELPAALTAESSLIFELPYLRVGVSTAMQVLARSASEFRGLVTNAAVLADDPVGSRSRVVTDIRGEADLSLRKTAVDRVLDTNLVDYVLSVSNAGPTVAFDLRVTDPLPAGTVLAPGSDPACRDEGTAVVCRVASLASGAVTNFRLRVELQSGLARILTNEAAVASADADPNLADNTDRALTELVDTDGDLLADFADPDDDNDTMDDDWENRYGLDQRDAADGSVDGDGDLVPNVEEHLADTDPRLGTDFLSILELDAEGLLFPSKSTRQYRLQCAETTTGPYLDMGLPPIVGDGSSLRVPIPKDAAFRLIRLVPER